MAEQDLQVHCHKAVAAEVVLLAFTALEMLAATEQVQQVVLAALVMLGLAALVVLAEYKVAQTQ
jgi:hypothetical protein